MIPRLLLSACSLAGGCATVVEPPPEPPDAVSAFLVDYGHHSGIVLPVGDGRGLMEYSYGERGWFALNRENPLQAFGTLVMSCPGSFARRPLSGPATAANVRDQVVAEGLWELRVDRAACESLAADLDRRWRDREATAAFNPATGLLHVDDRRTYHLLGHNCNHELADWLRRLGCRVRSFSVTADFRVTEPPQAVTAAR